MSQDPAVRATAVLPFKLPLTPEQFARALRAGLGRAVLHAQHYDCAGLQGLIVDACIHNYSYDPQCEGDRAAWMMQIVDATNTPDVVCDAVIKALTAKGDAGSYWDSQQTCSLAAAFAKRGSHAAREALYRALRQSPKGAGLIGGQQIIELAGKDGLLFVATRMAAWLPDDATMCCIDDPLRWYDEIHGQGRAMQILRAAAPTDRQLEAYLDALHRASSASPAPALQRCTAAELIQRVQTEAPDQNRFWFLGWGHRAAEMELLQVADALFAEPDAERVKKYLRVFSCRALAKFDARFLGLAKYPDAEVRALAYRALAHYAHPAVRELAIESVRCGHVSDGQLRLFGQNYRPGDERLIAPALPLAPDADELHALVSDLVTAFENCQHKEIAEIILFAYEYSPCGNCRADAVQILLRTESLPSWVRQECIHDAMEEIRDAVLPSSAGPEGI